MSENTLSTPLIHDEMTGILDHGSEFHGKLVFRGTVRINGTFRGEISTPDTLVIGEHARIHADIDAGVVVLSGELNGNIKAKHRVEIRKPAVFRGDIFTPSLRVEEGVLFEGSSKMATSKNS